MRNLKYVTVVITASLLWLSCKNKESDEVIVADSPCLNEKFLDKINLLELSKEPVTEGIHLTGTVESNPDRVVHFRSLISGIISKTYFSLGDEVQKGQVLAEIQSTELTSMQNELSTIQSQILVTQKHFESVNRMFQDGIASEKDLLQAQIDLDILKSERQKTKSNLNLYNASTERGVFQIKAPNSGIITSKTISAGTQISDDFDALFTISDLSEVWVMVNIYATNVRHIQQGMEVDIRTLSYPEEVFKGKIDAVSSVLDSDAKVLKARISLTNENVKLKPGMLVDVIALKKIEGEAIAIPTDALVFENNKNYVVIFQDRCSVERREVEILSTNNGTSFIKSGLAEGEKIVTKNQLLVFEQLNN
ncbi:MAG TPA: efflux RND transporter periplasmic adaptor subunit [Flavobacteriaceae bacterium]|nr:efflux RND transporter periplasmic adaptor subunit [Flavobacteriaceae bacterium]